MGVTGAGGQALHRGCCISEIALENFRLAKLSTGSGSCPACPGRPVLSSATPIVPCSSLWPENTSLNDSESSHVCLWCDAGRPALRALLSQSGIQCIHFLLLL